MSKSGNIYRTEWRWPNWRYVYFAKDHYWYAMTLRGARRKLAKAMRTVDYTGRIGDPL